MKIPSHIVLYGKYLQNSFEIIWHQKWHGNSVCGRSPKIDLTTFRLVVKKRPDFSTFCVKLVRIYFLKLGKYFKNIGSTT